MERRERKFLVSYHCYYCPHIYKWGPGATSHEVQIRAHTVGEAVLIAERDPYVTKELILGVREIGEVK